MAAPSGRALSPRGGWRRSSPRRPDSPLRRSRSLPLLPLPRRLPVFLFRQRSRRRLSASWSCPSLASPRPLRSSTWPWSPRGGHGRSGGGGEAAPPAPLPPHPSTSSSSTRPPPSSVPSSEAEAEARRARRERATRRWSRSSGRSRPPRPRSAPRHSSPTTSAPRRGRSSLPLLAPRRLRSRLLILPSGRRGGRRRHSDCGWPSRGATTPSPAGGARGGEWAGRAPPRGRRSWSREGRGEPGARRLAGPCRSLGGAGRDERRFRAASESRLAAALWNGEKT